MRADVHGGPEQKLQSEAGYIDARPQTDSSTKTSCNARPDHTYGSNSEVESHSRRVRSTPINGHRRTGPTGPFRAITVALRVVRRKCSEIPTVGSHWLWPFRGAVMGDHFLLLLRGAPSARRHDSLKRSNGLLASRRHPREFRIILLEQYADGNFA